MARLLQSVWCKSTRTIWIILMITCYRSKFRVENVWQKPAFQRSFDQATSRLIWKISSLKSSLFLSCNWSWLKRAKQKRSEAFWWSSMLNWTSSSNSFSLGTNNTNNTYTTKSNKAALSVSLLLKFAIRKIVGWLPSIDDRSMNISVHFQSDTFRVTPFKGILSESSYNEILIEFSPTY